MGLYMNEMPKSILEFVAKNFNCEDIAMSFMISSLSGGQPSLLADHWAIKSLLKLYVATTISGSNNHKSLRDECINSFATLLGLKDPNGSRRLKMSRFIHKRKPAFECGAPADAKMSDTYNKSKREIDLDHRMTKWRSLDARKLFRETTKLTVEAGVNAYVQGLIVNTTKWKSRFALQ
jgi:Glycosyl transferase family 64 domain